MSQPGGPIRLAGATLERYYHACAFFHSRDEEYRVLGPFVHEGLEQGEKAVHITDPMLRDDHLERLRAAGIEVTGPVRTGQLQILTWEDAYLRHGRFDPDAMLARSTT